MTDKTTTQWTCPWPSDLTERQREVLRELPDDMWVRPMDVGGRDSSHHSNTLRTLVLKGHARRKGHPGVSYKYRRMPDVAKLLAFVRILASYGCIEDGDDKPCGKCSPCEASAYLTEIGER